MNAQTLGTELTRWRRQAGLTQQKLAGRMKTKQPVISRIESGRSLPTLPLLEKFARECGRTEVILTINQTRPETTPEELRRRVKQVLGGYVFNPWERNPTPAEARTLLADGLTRERFQG